MVVNTPTDHIPIKVHLAIVTGNIPAVTKIINHSGHIVMPIISNLIISRYTLTFYNFRSICGLLLYIFVNKVTIK